MALAAADTAVVRIRRRTFFDRPNPPLAILSDSTFTDTVLRKSPGGRGLSVLFEAGRAEQLNYRYFVSAFCGDRFVVTRHGMRGAERIDSLGSCWRIVPGVSGQRVSRGNTLLGFGGIGGYFFEGDSPDYSFTARTDLRYMKLGACVAGTKIDVIKLGTGDRGVLPGLSIAPNPANAALRVAVSSSTGAVLPRLRLYSVSGSTLTEVQMSSAVHTLSTAGLPAGMYFLECTAWGWRQTLKVVVSH